MSDKATNSPYVRKIADRLETVAQPLSTTQVEAARGRICALLNQKDALKDKLKAFRSECKARADLLEREIAIERCKVTNEAADIEVPVEDWLTSTNEVITMHPATGEILKRRTATVRELQEDLPLDEDDGFGSGGSH